MFIHNSTQKSYIINALCTRQNPKTHEAPYKITVPIIENPNIKCADIKSYPNNSDRQ